MLEYIIFMTGFVIVASIIAISINIKRINTSLNNLNKTIKEGFEIISGNSYETYDYPPNDTSDEEHDNSDYTQDKS